MATLTDNSYACATASAAVIIFIITVFLLKNSKRNNIPTNWIAVGKVKNLTIYPVKSGHRKDLEMASCTKQGLIQLSPKHEKVYRLRDRNFVVYKEDTKQSYQHSKIFLIETHAYDEKHIVFKAPGMDPITVKIPVSDNEDFIIMGFTYERLNGSDCGDEVAKWLSRYILGRESGLRMGYGNGEKQRSITYLTKLYAKRYPKILNNTGGIYSSTSSYHLINQASVDDINSRVAENITVCNFRPNIVMEGAIAFAEDEWEWIKIGDTIFQCIMPALRCFITTYDPDTAKRHQNYEPMKTLRTYRLADGLPVELKDYPRLGLHLKMFNDRGTLSIGDTVYAGKSQKRKLL